jgi:phosphatidylinositol 4-kinase A
MAQKKTEDFMADSSPIITSETKTHLQAAKPSIFKGHEDRTLPLMLLLQHELQLLAVLHSPLQAFHAPKPPKASHMDAAVKAAWRLSPALAAAICNRFPACKVAAACLAGLVLEHSGKPEVQAWPQGASVYIAAAQAAHRKVTALHGWTTTSVAEALQLLAGPSGVKAEVKEYVMRSLSTAIDEELAFWLPQMLQGLRHDDGRLAQ